MSNNNSFAITEQHLKLIKELYIESDDSCYYGSPVVNPKRPYGNSSVFVDIAKIIGLEFEDELTEEQEGSMLYLHRQVATALQICLCTQSFRVGVYKKLHPYNDKSWVLVEETQDDKN